MVSINTLHNFARKNDRRSAEDIGQNISTQGPTSSCAQNRRQGCARTMQKVLPARASSPAAWMPQHKSLGRALFARPARGDCVRTPWQSFRGDDARLKDPSARAPLQRTSCRHDKAPGMAYTPALGKSKTKTGGKRRKRTLRNSGVVGKISALRNIRLCRVLGGFAVQTSARRRETGRFQTLVL